MKTTTCVYQSALFITYEVRSSFDEMVCERYKLEPWDELAEWLTVEGRPDREIIEAQEGRLHPDTESWIRNIHGDRIEEECVRDWYANRVARGGGLAREDC